MALVLTRPVDGSFAEYVAHELRTPLTTQRCLLELALADSTTDLAAWREIGEDVLGACRRQEQLLEACLTLARSRDGLDRSEPVDLAAVAAAALRAHDPCGLERIVALGPAQTRGVPGLIERLAANLVSNAIRHNVAGGRIEVETRTEAGLALLCVTNTGPLIPAGELDRLFRPFHRLDASPAPAGLGLGLAIVEAIADAHGAALTARAHPRGGLAVDVAFTSLD